MDPLFDKLIEKAEYGDSFIEANLQAMCNSLIFQKDVRGFVMGSQLLDALYPLVNQLLTQEDLFNINLSSEQDIIAYRKSLKENLINQVSSLLKYITEDELNVHKLAINCFQSTLDGQVKPLSSKYYEKDSLDECLLAKSKGSASPRTYEAFLTLKKAVLAINSQDDILKKALQFYPFFEMAKFIAKEMLIFEKEEGRVIASKMPLLAKGILNLEYGISSTLCRLGNNLQHILLDEFQDTSREQWEALSPLIIEALSRGGSLTWVGDVKQAIYGWRGGDVALFDELLHKDELTCMATVKPTTLDTNWRSAKAIVDFNNNMVDTLANKDKSLPILKAILSKDCPTYILEQTIEQTNYTFENAQQKLKPSAEESNAQEGYVCIEEIEAELVEDLAEAVQAKLYEKLQYLKNYRQWNDITILTRSNSGSSQVAEWLLAWEIPVITENSLYLNRHILIKESVAFLTFLHTPQDNLSFWIVLTGEILRSSIFNAESKPKTTTLCPSLAEIHDLALELKDKESSLAMAFKEKWPLFWEKVFAPFYNRVLSPYDCIQGWYKQRRVFKRFPEAKIFLRRFLEVVYSAEGQGSNTLATFLDYWKESGDEEKTPNPTKLNAVSVMTIHKAKGLQFPVVIIPWLSFNIKDNAPFMLQNVGPCQVFAPCNKYTENDIFYLAQKDAVLETLNLFYVACTRAKEELYAFHTHTSHLLKKINLACGLMELFKIYEQDYPIELGLPFGSNEENLASSNIKTDISTNNILEKQILTQDFDIVQDKPELMPWVTMLKIFRNPLQVLEDDAKSYKNLSPTKRGLLIHHCLEILQDMGQVKEDSLIEEKQSLAEQATLIGLQSFTMPFITTEELKVDIIKALTWYLSLPELDTWKENAVPEQGILTEENQLYRVDLLIPPQANFGYRAVEFKTGYADTKHIDQLSNYLSLLDDISCNIADNKQLPKSQGVLIYLDLQKCRMLQGQKYSELLDVPAWGMQLE